MTNRIKQILVGAIALSLVVITFAFCGKKEDLLSQEQLQEREQRSREANPIVYRPELIHSGIIRSEYVRDIMRRYTSFSTDAQKLFSKTGR